MRNKLEFLTTDKGHRWEKWDYSTIEYHRWNRYNNVQIPTWYWEKYAAIAEPAINTWNQYAVNYDTRYTWDKYGINAELIDTRYYWNKYNIEEVITYPSWRPTIIPRLSTAVYTWDRYTTNPSTLGLAMNGTTQVFHPENHKMKRWIKMNRNRTSFEKWTPYPVVSSAIYGGAETTNALFTRTYLRIREVISNTETRELARELVMCSYNNDYRYGMEGKFPYDMYPIGRTFAFDETIDVSQGVPTLGDIFDWETDPTKLTVKEPYAGHLYEFQWTDIHTGQEKGTLTDYGRYILDNYKPDDFIQIYQVQTESQVKDKIESYLQTYFDKDILVDFPSSTNFIQSNRHIGSLDITEPGSGSGTYPASQVVDSPLDDVISASNALFCPAKQAGCRKILDVKYVLNDTEAREVFDLEAKSGSDGEYPVYTKYRTTQGSIIIPEDRYEVGSIYVVPYYRYRFERPLDPSITDIANTVWSETEPPQDDSEEGVWVMWYPEDTSMTPIYTTSETYYFQFQEDGNNGVVTEIAGERGPYEWQQLFLQKFIDIRWLPRCPTANDQSCRGYSPSVYLARYYDPGSSSLMSRSTNYTQEHYTGGIMTLQYVSSRYETPVTVKTYEKDGNAPIANYQSTLSTETNLSLNPIEVYWSLTKPQPDGYYYVPRSQGTYRYIEDDWNYFSDVTYTEGALDTSNMTLSRYGWSLNAEDGQWQMDTRLERGDPIYFLDRNNPTIAYQVLKNGYCTFSIHPIDHSKPVDDYPRWAIEPRPDKYVGGKPESSSYYQIDLVLEDTITVKEFVERVEVIDNPNAYPHKQILDGYWFEYVESIANYNYSKGDYITTISVLNDPQAYQEGRSSDGYWYIFVSAADEQNMGALIGQVTSTDLSAFPSRGIQDGSWYIYVGSQVHYHKGSELIEIVQATAQTAYPQDERQGSYWYVPSDFKILEKRGSLMDSIEDTDRHKFPDDGLQGNIWYEYILSYYTSKPHTYIEDTWSDSYGAYPINDVRDGIYYKYLGYKYIPRYIIGDTLLMSGIKYQQDVNSQEDYAPGDVAAAQIDFTILSEPRDAQKYLDLECDYYTRQQQEDSWQLVGHFTITAASDMTATTTKITGFDNVIKLDKDVSSYLFDGDITYPISIYNLYTGLCNYCGVTGTIDESAVNTDFMVQDNFTTKNITARQVLGLIAEVAAGFVKADEDGNIVLRGYSRTSSSLDKTKYVRNTQGIYDTQKIDKLNVAMSTDDIGVSYGTGEVLYRIIDNPLLYIEDEHEIDTQMRNIYNVISAVQYTPTELELLEPLAVKTGDIITVDGHTAYVQSVEWDGSIVKIKSKGKRERDVEKNQIDGSLDKLRGKSNELSRTLDETRSRITDVEAGLRTEISQTAGEIRASLTNTKEDLENQISITAAGLSADITNAQAGFENSLRITAEGFQADLNSALDGLENSFSATAGGFEADLTDLKEELEGKISASAESLTTSFTNSLADVSTQIQQTADSISLTYNSQTGTASIRIGDVTVSNLTTSGYVNQQVAGVELTGYVKFADLSTPGYTLIHGANIITGTISANNINLTGAITWSDLSSGVQNAIEGSGSSSGGDGVPSYIQPTYIDSVNIMSPNIYGGKITAGTSADGYIQMTDSGMNFISSTGGNLVGIGYLASNYNYPHIIFGAGADAYGGDKGMIKKFSDGMWIGDNDSANQASNRPTVGTGVFIQFSTGKVYKVINGTYTEL